MGVDAHPTSDCGSEMPFPTVDDLITLLRTSFFSHEFQYVAKTLKDREHFLIEKHLKLQTQVEKEKSLLLAENLKLNDELKQKQEEVQEMRKLNAELKKKHDEIEEMMRLKAELETKIRVCAKRSLDFDDDLENKQQKDRLSESNLPLLVDEKEDSKKRAEPNVPVIIHIDDDDDGDEDEGDDHMCISSLKGKKDLTVIKKECNTDDDDDDHKCISSLKGKRDSTEIKKECNADDDVEFTSTRKRRRVSNETKRELHVGSVKLAPCVETTEFDTSASDSDSDTKIKKLYMSTIAKMKTQKERWESESDMVKDLEEDDELCLNGICALDRQRIIVHGTDILRMANLVSKLIDGDPQRKLKKKASELDRFDLDQCRMFAKKYYVQLFNIYQKKSDPFFPASTRQEKRVR